MATVTETSLPSVPSTKQKCRKPAPLPRHKHRSPLAPPASKCLDTTISPIREEEGSRVSMNEYCSSLRRVSTTSNRSSRRAEDSASDEEDNTGDSGISEWRSKIGITIIKGLSQAQ